MKKLILATLAAAALCGATVAASAQDMRIRSGEGGVTIRTDRDHRHGGWDRRDGRRHVEERVIRRDRRVTVMQGERCRVVSVRSVRPNGDVVIRRSRQCR
ncbi:MAG: hypothetical protein J0H01_28445 [Rhizobiales bacterium]|nr:hypothetical protein [Hyphomicrobiales bacterium]